MMADDLEITSRMHIKAIEERNALIANGERVIWAVKDSALLDCIKIMAALGKKKKIISEEALDIPDEQNLRSFALAGVQFLGRKAVPDEDLKECFKKMEIFVETGEIYKEQGEAFISKIGDRFLPAVIREMQRVRNNSQQAEINTCRPDDLRRAARELWQSLQSSGIWAIDLKPCLEVLERLAKQSQPQTGIVKKLG